VNLSDFACLEVDEKAANLLAVAFSFCWVPLAAFDASELPTG
jgi:hypothetical protein